MSSNKNSYDKNVNTFSPEGRIFQVEYAINASKLGSSGIGLRYKDGIILASEKKFNNKLVIKSGIDKLNKIDKHIYCLVSGLISDSQILVDKARVEALNHRNIYQEECDIKVVTQSIADIMLNFGEGDITTKAKPFARPFGVSLLFGGVDLNGPNLYLADPSGTIIGYKAKGIGVAEEGIESLLEQHYKDDMSLDEGIILVMSIFKQVMEEEINCNNFELVYIDNENIFKNLNEDQKQNYFRNLKNLN